MAAVLNLTVTAGDDRSWTLTFTNSNTMAALDISTWTLTGDIRETFESNTVLGSFTLAVTDGPNGVASMTLPNAVSAVLPEFSVYDVQADIAGTIRTYFKGTIETEPQATR